MKSNYLFQPQNTYFFKNCDATRFPLKASSPLLSESDDPQSILSEDSLS